MAKYKVNIPLEADTPDIATKKAKVLTSIGEVLTLSNLEFLESLKKKKDINKTLANPVVRMAIKSKL